MTIRLYQQNVDQLDFSAVVVSCEKRDGGYAVVLDQTAFFPEGGGQGADHGTLDDVRVLDAHEKQGEVEHLTSAPLEVGREVHGHVDGVRRLDMMQQHSGEHMFSGLVHGIFGYDNVGFHIGTEAVTMDFNGPLTEEDVHRVELLANQAIWRDQPIEVFIPSREELANIEYRSKKEIEGDVRIVRIEGVDTCACCGTHVQSSGQVGLVKLLSCQKFRDGVRLELLCGRRAADYLSRCWEQSRAAGQTLSVKPTALAPAVSRLQSELTALKEKAARLEEQSFVHTAAQYEGAGDVLLITGPLEGDGVRRLCDAVAKSAGGRCAVFSGTDGSYRYAVISTEDVSPLVKAMNQSLSGRGGGRNGFAQGSAACTAEAIRAFFAAL